MGKKKKSREEILACEIRPGMVIRKGKKGNKSTRLILAVDGFDTVEYESLDLDLTSAMGPLVSTMPGRTKVEVFKGKERQDVLVALRDEAYDQLFKAERIVNTLRLIEALEEQNEQ